MPLLKFAHSFDPYGWIRVLVHGLGFDRHSKGWMGEVWKREFARWFLGPSGGVWGPSFFSHRESRREDHNGGLESSFRQTDGETREERRFGPYLEPRSSDKVSVCANHLKIGETFTCEKTGKIGDDRF